MKTIAQLPPVLIRFSPTITVSQLEWARTIDRQMGYSDHRLEQLYLQQFSMPPGYEQYNRYPYMKNPCKNCCDELEDRPEVFAYYMAQFVLNPLIESGWSHGCCIRHVELYRVVKRRLTQEEDTGASTQ